MNTSNMQTTQQLLADIYQRFRFIPPIFLALRETPDVLQSFWQQVYTNYVLNPLPYLFKEKLFLALSYHSHAPYDLRCHSIILHRLGLQEQEILTFLRTPCITTQDMKQYLLFLHTQPPLTEWFSLDEHLEHTLLFCAAHMHLGEDYAEECRMELQRFLGFHYIHLSAVLSTIKLYHHWVEALQGHLSVNEETFIPQQFAQSFASGTALEHHLHAHYTQCLFERRNKDRTKQATMFETTQNKQRTNRSLKALLALAEILVLGSNESAGPPSHGEEAWTTHALLKHMLDLTQDILGCEHMSLITTNATSDHLQPVALIGFSSKEERSWWHHIPETSLLDQLHDPELVERTKRGEVLVLDKRHLPFQILPDTDNTYSWLAAPMMLGSHLIGLLSFDYGPHEHHYTADEMHGASAISRLFALTLEREHLLQERAEMQAREIALTEANERMHEFLSIAGHELKTPLTSIKGNIQLLRRRMEREQISTNPAVESCSGTGGYSLSDVQSILLRADRQIDRLTRLVRDIIEVSRIRAKRLNMHMIYCDLIQVVQSTFDQQQLQTPQRIFSLALPSTTVPVFVDIDYIEQVITNYLSNALKYSASDKPIKISLAVDDETARLSIQDEGPGVALEEQELIWESFYQAKNNAVRSGSSIGFGLGLAISRSIIEAHGGQVGIHSTPDDNGSIFWFSLPLTPPDREREKTDP